MGILYEERYPTGELRCRGEMNECGLRDGTWTWWYANGQKEMQGSYANGLEEGEWIYWHLTGHEASRGRYERGRKVGLWTYGDDEGQFVCDTFYAPEEGPGLAHSSQAA